MPSPSRSDLELARDSVKWKIVNMCKGLDNGYSTVSPPQTESFARLLGTLLDAADWLDKEIRVTPNQAPDLNK